MAIRLDVNSYVPTLAIRPAEMNGLEQLPSRTKDALSPIFLLAPWVGAHGLDKAPERIEKAFPRRAYFLDLDRYYDISNPSTETQEEFASLFDKTEAYSNWCNFVAANERIHPCIQMPNQSEDELNQQIQKVREMDRAFCVRIELNRIPANLSNIVAVLNNLGAADFVIAIDAGLVTADVNIVSAQIEGLIQTQFADIDARVPIVVSFTTIPLEYSSIEGVEPVAFKNRQIVRQIAANNNFRTIVYGDWGSTRPRMPERIARQPFPRMDYPARDEWVFARNKAEGWDYPEAAQAITRTPQWAKSYGLNIWGERMIEQTTVNAALGIGTPSKNVASRVNIHLHRQAFYNESDLSSLDLDEEWED